MSALRALALGCVAQVAGCVFDAAPPDDARIECVADRDCPETWRCARGAFVCARPDDACVDLEGGALIAKEDGAPCDAEGAARVCLSARCVKSVCGDGVVDARRAEQCDFGAENDDARPDACRADCTPAACGDGVVDSFESCDGVADAPRTCELCVASCTLHTGRCGADDDSCGCRVEVLAEGDLGFDSLFSISVDEAFVYWFQGPGELVRTPRDGGLSEIIATVPDAEVAIDVQAEAQYVCFIIIETGPSGPVPILRRVTKATGALVSAGAAAALALSGDDAWVVAYTLSSLDRDTLARTDRFVPETFAYFSVAALEDTVVVADDAGTLWAFDAAGDGPPTAVAERRFDVKGLRGAGGVVTWWNGADVEAWRPGEAAPTQLARLSDGQLGLELHDFTIHDDVAYVMVGDRSARRPGGIMELVPGDTAWRMVVRTAGYRMRVTDEAFFFSGGGPMRFDRE